MVVHSLHLRPILNSSEENTLFESAYNHLEMKLRDKLKPGEPRIEIERINLHLSAAADLLKHVMSLCDEYMKLNE